MPFKAILSESGLYGPSSNWLSVEKRRKLTLSDVLTTRLLFLTKFSRIFHRRVNCWNRNAKRFCEMYRIKYQMHKYLIANSLHCIWRNQKGIWKWWNTAEVKWSINEIWMEMRTKFELGLNALFLVLWWRKCFYSSFFVFLCFLFFLLLTTYSFHEVWFLLICFLIIPLLLPLTP